MICELIYGSSASTSKFRNDKIFHFIFPWKHCYNSTWQLSQEKVKSMRTYHFYSAIHRVHFLRSRSKFTAPYIVLIVYVMSLDFFLNFKCVFIGIVRVIIIIIWQIRIRIKWSINIKCKDKIKKCKNKWESTITNERYQICVISSSLS